MKFIPEGKWFAKNATRLTIHRVTLSHPVNKPRILLFANQFPSGIAVDRLNYRTFNLGSDSHIYASDNKSVHWDNAGMLSYAKIEIWHNFA